MVTSKAPSSPGSCQTPKVPCAHCRSKHIKCTYEAEECSHCQRYGVTCVRLDKPKKPLVQFKTATRSHYEREFAPDQVWLQPSCGRSSFQFLNETDDVAASYFPVSSQCRAAWGESAGNEMYTAGTCPRQHAVDSPASDAEDPLGDTTIQDDIASHDLLIQTPDELNPLFRTAEGWPVALSPDPGRLDAAPGASAPNETLVNPSTDPLEITDLRLRAILLRYFAEEIGPRFDLCDDERNFSRVVPQRALSSPTLQSAIITTAARHLARLERYRHPSGAVEWRGHLLAGLTEETAVFYHNECIQGLIRLSEDPQQIHNEDLLAAAVILRTDEEMDGPQREGKEDAEVFLGLLNVFLKALVHSVAPLSNSPSQITSTESHQANTPPPSQSASLSPPLLPSDNSLPLVPRGIQEAAFWVALRQEIFTSFLKQRPPNFPLGHCQAYRSLVPANDAVWANRLIIFCADVLNFSYGERSDQHWEELKEYERGLTAALPRSFEPVYARTANPEKGEIFPEIWHLQSCHVTGTNHLELARILLAAFDSSRPKLGPTYATRQRELAGTLKAAVVRLCGVARCNSCSAPAFIEALMAITMCGGYFEDPREQEALLETLRVMTRDHAYPTAKVEHALVEAWGYRHI